MSHPADTREHIAPSTYFLRMTLGLVYFHFGFLKFFPELSPAENLASQTIIRLSWDVLDARQALWLLAAMETLIGLGLLFNVCRRLTFVVFLLHMIGTFSPIFLLPGSAFRIYPFAPTMEGQYILKNLVFIAAGWTVLLPHAFPSRSTELKFSNQPTVRLRCSSRQETVMR